MASGGAVTPFGGGTGGFSLSQGKRQRSESEDPRPRQRSRGRDGQHADPAAGAGVAKKKARAEKAEEQREVAAEFRQLLDYVDELTEAEKAESRALDAEIAALRHALAEQGGAEAEGGELAEAEGGEGAAAEPEAGGARADSDDEVDSEGAIVAKAPGKKQKRKQK
eukprot:TRINITY_DN8709_c0_g1_i1.p1 TRINITY_DN8709_c0_g1~~TRINITY_DN8709_c0_g1_i1.p1  ORF type:complete len:166 (+),score=63.50 TRINITY_DN8709_c0_g1_i1:223-720(+)